MELRPRAEVSLCLDEKCLKMQLGRLRSSKTAQFFNSNLACFSSSFSLRRSSIIFFISSSCILDLNNTHIHKTIYWFKYHMHTRTRAHTNVSLMVVFWANLRQPTGPWSCRVTGTNFLCGWMPFLMPNNNKLSYRRGTTQRAVSLQVLSTAAKLYE